MTGEDLAGLIRIMAPSRSPIMAAATPDTPAGLRDRALILLGFAAALRRTELVGLNVEDLEETEGGLCIRIARSKTDQEGQGTVIAIVPGSVACPIKSIKSWLAAAKITDGPIFRPIVKGGRVTADRLSEKSVVDIIKCYANASGSTPSLSVDIACVPDF